MLLHDCAISCVNFIDVENKFLGPLDKKPLVLGSFLKKKTERTHTFAILFNTANIVTTHDFKSRDFSRTLQLPCQNGLHIGSNCISRDTLLKELATLPPRKLPQK